MKKIIAGIISTRKGWLVRQGLKGITVASASLSTWLLAKGADAETASAIVAGATSVAAWGIETGLSKLASKIATP